MYGDMGTRAWDEVRYRIAWLRELNVNEALRMTWLRMFLRVLAAGFLAAFVPWITLILLNVPVLAPGGRLAPLLRFQPYNAHYESMLVAIHIVWAVMLWRAAGRPAEHPLFIDFTIWANAAHGLVMVIATPMQKGPVMMVIEALPLFGIAAVLWWLRPRSRIPSVSSELAWSTTTYGTPGLRENGQVASQGVQPTMPASARRFMGALTRVP